MVVGSDGVRVAGGKGIKERWKRNGKKEKLVKNMKIEKAVSLHSEIHISG